MCVCVCVCVVTYVHVCPAAIASTGELFVASGIIKPSAEQVNFPEILLNTSTIRAC